MGIVNACAAAITCRCCGEPLAYGNVHAAYADEDAAIRARGASFRYTDNAAWDAAEYAIEREQWAGGEDAADVEDAIYFGQIGASYEVSL